MQELKARYAELEQKEKAMRESMKALGVDETKVDGAAPKNESIIGKDLTGGVGIQIDTSGLVPRHTHEPLTPEQMAKKTPETPLLKELKQIISMQGPMSIDDYMREVLTHPQHGYYSANVQSLGEAGDFTTAPEVTLFIDADKMKP